MPRIVPNLWFDDQAEQAAQFYTSLFEDSQVGRVVRLGDSPPQETGRPAGGVLTVSFRLAGQEFVALNGGPQFEFNPAISFLALLEREEQVDELWRALGEGGDVLMPMGSYEWSERYGWLQDRYGLSWQVMLGEREDVGQAIFPSLLFVGSQHGRAEEAVHFYTSVFEGSSSVTGILRYGPGEGEPEGTVKHAQFRLLGQTFMANDSSQEHGFGFNESVSFLVECASQEEIDRYWERLSAYPEAERCGWLKDRFGVSWQVVPTALPALLAGPDPRASERVMNALMGMKKIDVAALEEAHGSTLGPTWVLQ